MNAIIHRHVALAILVGLSLSCQESGADRMLAALPGPEYVLPYPVGTTYTCSQGFEGPYSHAGTFRYAVDFTMPRGAVVTAARNGRVVHVVASYSDNDPTEGHENVVIVMHEDSTYARDAHLTTNGVQVVANQRVLQGDTVGWSGSSGTSSVPHLHFDVTATFEGRSDQTIPFDFKNTGPHPYGLQMGVSYTALPYGK